MTVSELVTKLNRLNPNAEVFFQTSEGNQEAVNDLSYSEMDDPIEPSVILSMDTIL